MVGESDGSSVTLLTTDRPELLEGLGTIDGWLLDTGGLEDIVGSSIAGDRTL